MSTIEELRSLELGEPERWPASLRKAAAALVLVSVAVAGSCGFAVRTQIPLLDRARLEEQALMAEFESKQRRAANFDAYGDQLAEIERSFGALLRLLPGRTEVPNLLDDISRAGQAAGLEELLFQPAQELQRDFYAELPIRMRLSGRYHELGQFVSDVAALPRIVTLHDIAIEPVDTAAVDELILDVTARTYRYLDEEVPQ